MEIHVRKAHGIRNDLLMTVPLSEIEDILLHIANRDKLAQLPGLLRHVREQDAEERRKVDECKIPVEDHLKQLSNDHDLLDVSGVPKRPILVIGSRNVGNNYGFVAWQKNEKPKLFHIREEPFIHSTYSCLVKYEGNGPAIRTLAFERERIFDGKIDVTEDIAWAVYANQVLKDGKVIHIEETIDQFYDIRHVLAFERERAEGVQIEAEVYDGYPDRFRENLLRVWREKGVPRSRYLHSCLGLSGDTIIILQREGTIEEIALWLNESGAMDGVILDNGASPFCWAWWLYPKGGFLFTAPDFRPRSSAIIALILKGPPNVHLPGGSVGATIV